MAMAGALSVTHPNTSSRSNGRDAHDVAADRVVAANVVSGDEGAFEALVSRYYARVARIAGRFFRQPDMIEEIAQDVFVKVYVNMAGYRGEMPLEHWISRVAVNACYDQL